MFSEDGKPKLFDLQALTGGLTSKGKSPEELTQLRKDILEVNRQKHIQEHGENCGCNPAIYLGAANEDKAPSALAEAKALGEVKGNGVGWTVDEIKDFIKEARSKLKSEQDFWVQELSKAVNKLKTAKNWDTETVRALYACRGWSVNIDWEYLNNTKKVPSYCEQGHLVEKKITNFLLAPTCPKCLIQRKTAFVVKVFLLRGWVIKEGWQYSSNAAKIPFTCNNGHEYEIGLDKFEMGRGCGICNPKGKNNAKKGKHFQDRARKAFAEVGWTIPLDWVFVSSEEKIPFTCNNGHTHAITWASFESGSRCGYCSGRYVIDTEQVINAFENRGWIVESHWKGYVNNSEPIPFVCDKGHRHSMPWCSFKAGVRCGVCAGRYDKTDEIKLAFSLRGFYIFESWAYSGKDACIPFICDKGHIHQMSWNNFKKGTDCGYCSGRYSTNTEQVIKAFKERGWSVGSDWKGYVNNSTGIPFICDKGHRHFISWHRFKAGGGCGVCAGRYDKTDEIIDAFRMKGWIVFPGWIFSDVDTPIPFTCDRGHAHYISWSAFIRETACGQCFAHDRKELAYLYSLGNVGKWIWGRTYSRNQHLTDEQKAILKTKFSLLLKKDNLESTRQVLNKRKLYEDTDHIIPCSLFDWSNAQEIHGSASAFNLRNIASWVNRSRGDGLTLSEIVRVFHDKRLRVLYNSASNFSKKIELGLPISLPVECDAFKDWCEQLKIPQKDIKKFNSWNTQLEASQI